jgi:hypothetical protein
LRLELVCFSIFVCHCRTRRVLISSCINFICRSHTDKPSSLFNRQTKHTSFICFTDIVYHSTTSSTLI